MHQLNFTETFNIPVERVVSKILQDKVCLLLFSFSFFFFSFYLQNYHFVFNLFLKISIENSENNLFLLFFFCIDI